MNLNEALQYVRQVPPIAEADLQARVNQLHALEPSQAKAFFRDELLPFITFGGDTHPLLHEAFHYMCVACLTDPKFSDLDRMLFLNLFFLCKGDKRLKELQSELYEKSKPWLLHSTGGRPGNRGLGTLNVNRAVVDEFLIKHMTPPGTAATIKKKRITLLWVLLLISFALWLPLLVTMQVEALVMLAWPPGWIIPTVRWWPKYWRAKAVPEALRVIFQMKLPSIGSFVLYLHGFFICYGLILMLISYIIEGIRNS